jgi:hypothetical protein
MRIRLNGEFTEEYLVSFLETMDEIPLEESVKVYLSTNGGYSYVADIIANVLNEYKNLKLYIVNDISSAGFILSLKVKCHIEVLDNFTTAIVHLSSNDYGLTTKGNPRYPYARWLLEKSKDYYQSEIKELEKVLTKEEMVEIKEGNDVYLDSARLKEIYAKNNKKRKI